MYFVFFRNILKSRFLTLSILKLNSFTLQEKKEVEAAAASEDGDEGRGDDAGGGPDELVCMRVYHDIPP